MTTSMPALNFVRLRGSVVTDDDDDESTGESTGEADDEVLLTMLVLSARTADGAATGTETEAALAALSSLLLVAL